MRDQGRLVEWFDDKGYGFIQPNDAHKDRVFIHIKDFARTGPRPIVGCALEYVVILDERGRYRAQQATYLKASQVIEHRSKPAQPTSAKRWSAMQIGIVIYIVFMLIASFSKLLPPYTLLFVSLMNVVELLVVCARQRSSTIGESPCSRADFAYRGFFGWLVWRMACSTKTET
jgi:cold shock CspA family protein